MKIFKTDRLTGYNEATGEVEDKDIRSSFKVNDFVFVFDKMITKMESFKSEAPVLHCIALHSEMNKGYCILTQSRREELAKELKISLSSFNMKFYRLVKKGFIIFERGNAYYDFTLLWKGSLRERQKAIETMNKELLREYRADENKHETIKENIESI